MSGSNDPAVSDEAILNAIRVDERIWVPTKEIADRISIGKRRTGGRLNDLEAQGRVSHEVVGQSYVWQLADGEPTEQVDPDLGRIVRTSAECRRLGGGVVSSGKLFFFVGGAAALISLSASVQGVTIPFITNSALLVTAYVLLAGGGAASVLGFALQLIGILAPRVAEYRFLGAPTDSRPREEG